jgi:outer membrane protein OmpA-like peptidoglycan-associated protein
LLAFDFISDDSTIFYSALTASPKNLYGSELAIKIDHALTPELDAELVSATLDKGKGVRVSTIVFDYEDAALHDADMQRLDEIIDLVRDLDDVKIQLNGHNFGFDTRKQEMSQKRVLNIIQYLETRGVPSRMISYSYDDRDPSFRAKAAAFSDDTANFYIRRVDVKIIPMK